MCDGHTGGSTSGAQNSDRTDETGYGAGAYHDGRYVQSGTYYPSDDVVRVTARGGPDPTIEVTKEKWLEMSSSRNGQINRTAERQRELLKQGRLTEQPLCNGDDCDSVVLPKWQDISEDVPVDITSEPLCESCLERRYEDEYTRLYTIYPWMELDDELASHIDSIGVDAFDDPGDVLEPLRDPAEA